MNFPNKGEDKLDLFYTDSHEAYKSIPHTHLGLSDHFSVMLMPAYRSVLICPRQLHRHIRDWPAGAVSALQDCFEHADWNMFKEGATYGQHTDLEEYFLSLATSIYV